MIGYTENNSFDAASIYDLSDLVKGGSTGTSNTPLEALFNRTLWLKNRLFAFDSLAPLSANANIDSSIYGKIVAANATNGNFVITLSDFNTFPLGYILPVYLISSGFNNVTIQAATGQKIYLNDSYIDNVLYMHGGESLQLMRDSNGWTVIGYKGNFENVGNCLSSYTAQKGTLIRNGVMVNRSDVPRLWKWVNEKLVYGGQVVDETTWQTLVGNPGIPAYQGCFSRGNTTTTFRLPDDRGTFDRYLDNGRGLDNDRIQPYAGGYETDSLKSHVHSQRDTFLTTYNNNSGVAGLYPNKDQSPKGSNNNSYGQSAIDGDGAYNSHLRVYDTMNTGQAGGNETYPKNNAKIPLIIY